MTSEQTLIQPCGDGWCVKTPAGMEGPLESQKDAAKYLSLLQRVNAARSELACQDLDCL